MKRILTFFKLDISLALRDSVVIYSLVSPLLLAVILRLVIPSVQDLQMTLVVPEGLDSRLVERLDEVTTVETVASEEDVLSRVNENDNAAGIRTTAAGYSIVLEGNEEPGFGATIATVLADATGEIDGVRFETTDLGGPGAPISEYGATMLAMLGLFVGGIIVGFNIVEEKEGGVIRALAVSPLRINEYIVARSIIALIIGIVSSVLSALIVMGAGVNYAALLAALVASLFVALPFGFIIGALADNQMTAFALLKLLMAAFMTLPFVSVFVPATWQWVFYILPNYWMFQSLANAFLDSAHVGLGLSLPLTVVTGAGMIALLYGRMKRGLRLR